jgi:hypothetical protein
MFEVSEERSKMLKMFSGLLQEKAKFSCLVDGIIEYHLVLPKEKYVIGIIADDNFIDEMSIEWLLDIKRVQYYNVTRVISDVKIEELEFNINNNIN